MIVTLLEIPIEVCRSCSYDEFVIVQYDGKLDALYIELATGKYNRTRKISDAILVDEDIKGKILGIEILDAKKNIQEFDLRRSEIIVQTT